MGTISAWVRRASATTLTAVGLTAAAAFVAANWLWSVDSSPPKPPPPTTLQELTLRELAGDGPAGVTAHFRYVNSLVPTTNLVPDATLIQPTLVATIQVLAIVTGHVLGVVLAHERAVSLFDRRVAVLGQLPLLALMVAYTCGGLFLLFSS